MEPWEVDEEEDSIYEAGLATGSAPQEGKQTLIDINHYLDCKQEDTCTVWCFGKNKSGELSLKHNRNVITPEGCKLPFAGSPAQITSGGSHSAAVDSEGRMFICGNNTNGKLGLEKITSSALNAFRIFPQSNKKAVLQVECGESHTICLLEVTGFIFPSACLLQ